MFLWKNLDAGAASRALAVLLRRAALEPAPQATGEAAVNAKVTRPGGASSPPPRT